MSVHSPIPYGQYRSAVICQSMRFADGISAFQREFRISVLLWLGEARCFAHYCLHWHFSPASHASRNESRAFRPRTASPAVVKAVSSASAFRRRNAWLPFRHAPSSVSPRQLLRQRRGSFYIRPLLEFADEFQQSHTGGLNEQYTPGARFSAPLRLTRWPQAPYRRRLAWPCLAPNFIVSRPAATGVNNPR